jgi:TonB family protein
MILALLILLGSGAFAVSAQEAQRSAGPPYRVGNGITAPERISGAPPVYTEMARRARVMGTVIVEAIIDERGDVTNVRVLKGLPMGLDRAAVEAVQSWKFKPALMDGRPVKVYYALTVNFQVEDDPPLGPLLQKFLKENPELAEHVRAKRNYAEAFQLLDRVPSDWLTVPEVSLARCYLMLKQGRVEDAWEEAQSYRGPIPYEMLYLVGAYARDRAFHDGVLSPDARAALVDLGLQAVNMALEARSDGVEATAYKALLLREKAKLTLDPQERSALEDEAMQLQRRAMEIQARGREGGGTPQN